MIPFVKAHADGNDFLIIEERFAADRAAMARTLCDRHTGIGADGVEWFLENGDGLRIELTNADGSYAEISGNGTRCVAAWWASKRRVSSIEIETGAGLRRCEIVASDFNNATVRTSMGGPVTRPMVLELGAEHWGGIFVSTGNPHFVMQCDEFPRNWQDIGARLTNHPDFADGANIEFVRRISADAIEFRIYERGAGPTRSSGTGSVASAVAAMTLGASRKLRVQSQGGIQMVEWPEGEEISLIGDAHLIARGEAWL